MDSFAKTFDAASTGLPVSGETLFYVTLALAVFWRLGGTASRPGLGFGGGRSAKLLLQECAPEAASLAACLALAMLLRSRGLGKVAEADEEAWAKIVEQWPLLITADTLLSLQAMLRLVVLLCLVLRGGGGEAPLPLAEETSALWLGANTARLLLLCFSSQYMLDGPLGGKFPIACEIAVMPILAMLSFRTVRRAAFTLSTILAAALFFSARNNLNLSDSDCADALFVVAHSLDALAACAYLLRSALLERSQQDVSVSFAHLLMPLQQGLAAYYFWKAFEIVPEMAGVGLGFGVPQVGNTVAFGAYFAAAALYVVE